MKRSRIFDFLFLIVSAALLGSCSGSNSNPASPGQSAVVGGNIMDHSGLQGTILKADLLFDGSVVASASFSQPSLYANLTGTLSSVKSGTHTVAFRVTSQSSSPNTYDVNAATVIVGTLTFSLGDRTATLSTGESISYSVSF